jgi:hypothetical protein
VIHISNGSIFWRAPFTLISLYQKTSKRSILEVLEGQCRGRSGIRRYHARFEKLTVIFREIKIKIRIKIKIGMVREKIRVVDKRLLLGQFRAA